MIEKVGKYKVVKELSRGGMGIVYLGLHPSLNRKVAIKMLPKELVSNKEFIQRFEREAKIIATLDNHNIVQVYDYEEAFGTYFIIMEFIDGKMLSDIMVKGKPMPSGQVAAIIAQMSGALAYAHTKGITHRDIKPGNAMIRPDGIVKLMDFGIAFSETADVNLTQEGKVIGTPKYMSPEQLQGKKIDQRSDIYSLGVMCYEMLAGRPPFEGKDFITIASKHLKDPPPPINSFVEDVSPEMEAFIKRALIKDREKRLPTLSGLQLTGDKDEKTIFHEAIQKKGISKKFFYLTLILLVVLAVSLIVGGQIKQNMMAEKGFKEQIETIANKQVKDNVLKANEYFDKADYKNANIYLQKALIIDPKNEVVKKGIAKVQKELEQAKEKKIKEMEAKADTLYASDNYLDAMAIWKEILLLDKSRTDIQQKLDRSEKVLDKDQNKLKASDHMEKGDDLESDGDLNGAEKEYMEAYILDPDSEEAPYALGLLFSLKYEGSENKEQNQEIIQKAIHFLEEAFAISSEHKGIIYNLSLAYLSNGQKDKAVEFAGKLKNIDATEGNNLLEIINSY